MRARGLAGLALAAALAAAPPAAAGVITSPAVVTPNPGNDEAGAANPNLVELSGGIATLGPSDSVFTVTSSGGVTEYQVVLVVGNATGQDWSGFRLELGTGVGDAFTPVDALFPLDFDVPDGVPTPTGGPFSAITHERASLRFAGGTVPAFFDVTLTFALDVPDGPAGDYTFTLRRVPEAAVPVPGPPAVIALGGVLAGLALARRRRAPGAPAPSA